PALVGFVDEKGHSVIRDEALGVGQPALQRGIRPNEFGLLQGIGILERWNGSRRSPEDAAEARPLFVAIERMAAATALLKQLFPGDGGLRRAASNPRQDRDEQCEGACNFSHPTLPPAPRAWSPPQRGYAAFAPRSHS